MSPDCLLTFFFDSGKCIAYAMLLSFRSLHRERAHCDLRRWDPNPPQLSYASALCGEPWDLLPQPTAGPGANTTFNSQPTFVLPFRCESGKTVIMYTGDRWNFHAPGGVRWACFRAHGGLVYWHAGRLQIDRVELALILRARSGRQWLQSKGRQAHGKAMATITHAFFQVHKLSTMCHA